MKRCGMVVGLAALVIIPFGFLWPDTEMVFKDLGCSAFEGRAHVICAETEAALEWTWFGHALLSPRWRVTWPAVRTAWCAADITPKDRQVIEYILNNAKDMRLQGAASSYLSLIDNLDGKGEEPENSLYHPKNPQYLLREKCS